MPVGVTSSVIANVLPIVPIELTSQVGSDASNGNVSTSVPFITKIVVPSGFIKNDFGVVLIVFVLVVNIALSSCSHPPLNTCKGLFLAMINSPLIQLQQSLNHLR